MPALDPMGMKNINFVGPADNIELVTPSNTEELGTISRTLLIGTPGALRVTTYGGQEVTIPESVVARGELVLRVRKVWAAGTTAQDIVSLY